MREHQQRSTQTAFQQSRFPDGVSIKLSHIRLAEIFPLEDAEELKEGLCHLFPTIDDKTGGEDVIGDISAFTTDLNSAGWRRVGMIVRQSNSAAYLLNRPLHEAPDLPPEVECIEVQLHKFLSSSIILTFDIHLTQEVTDHLLELHNQIYLPDIRFRKLLPWKLLAGWSEASPYAGVTDAIARQLKNLRIQIEKFLESYLVGYFLKASPSTNARLPAIEVFTLKGAPPKPDDLFKWLHEKAGWWSSIGFSFPSSIYCNEEMAFVLPDERKSNFKPAYRFVMLQEHDSATMNASEAMRSLIPAITIIELLQLVEKNIETLRLQTFQKMRPTAVKKWWLGGLIQLNDLVQWESMILDRVIMEFKQGKQWINYVTSGLEALENLDPQRRTMGNANLQATMLASVDYQAKLLGEHLSLIKKFSDGRLANLDIAVMYRLQMVAVLLTIVGAFAAIVEIWKEWEHIKEFFCQLLISLSSTR